MIIQTRYRDVPWDEIEPIHRQAGMSSDSLDWETEQRGRPVEIQTPAWPDTDYCGGPFYKVVKGPHGAMWVCPHLAEIGD